MGEGLADSVRGREREEYVEAAVVRSCRREVKITSTVLCPRLAVLRRVVGDHKLPGWVDGVGGEAEGDSVEAMPR
jgi:hypothetical protein